jgi:hypothetical protein
MFPFRWTDTTSVVPRLRTLHHVPSAFFHKMAMSGVAFTHHRYQNSRHVPKIQGFRGWPDAYQVAQP